MTVRDLFPDLEPSLNLDFGNVKALDPRVTFTRASSATYIDAGGLWQEASNNQPRFDHAPVTLESLGLLIEEQRTNTFTNPRMLNGVPGTPGTQPSAMGNWNLSTSGLTIEYVQNVTYNNLTGVRYRLSGTAAASASVSNLFSLLSSGWTASPGQNWTGSVFIAVLSGLETLNNFRLSMSARAGGGTAGTSASGSLLSSLLAVPTRFAQTYANLPATTTGIFHQVILGVTSGVAVDVTFELYWPQLEQGLFATSPILPPGTTIAASTRAADVASMTSTNFSSWYNQTEGTVFVQSSRYSAGTSGNQYIMFELSNLQDNLNFMALGSQFGTTSTQALVVYDNTTQFAHLETANIGMTKYTLAYKTNDFAYTKNGEQPTTDTSGTVPPVQQLNIGSRPAFGTVGFLNGTIKKLSYYSYRLSNTELQALTR
jgi:hypothetical protein